MLVMVDKEERESYNETGEGRARSSVRSRTGIVRAWAQDSSFEKSLVNCIKGKGKIHGTNLRQTLGFLQRICLLIYHRFGHRAATRHKLCHKVGKNKLIGLRFNAAFTQIPMRNPCEKSFM